MTLYDDLFQCSNKLWEMISLERVKFFTHTYICTPLSLTGFLYRRWNSEYILNSLETRGQTMPPYFSIFFLFVLLSITKQDVYMSAKDTAGCIKFCVLFI